MLAEVRTSSGATRKGVLQMEVTYYWNRASEQYSKAPGSSPGGDTCFSLQQKLLPVGGRNCMWLQKES